jgi:hypothetical protein
MKVKLLVLSVLSSLTISAQLTITQGAQFSVFSDTKLTLENTDLVNDGNLLLATTSPVSFTGNASSFIGGQQVVRFFKLEINKTANQSVSLHKTISIGSTLLFTSGFFNLNGFDLNLETNARLDGEGEDSRVIGPNGGNVVFSTMLNSPNAVNPANLGVIISSSESLGMVTIRRGHQAQVNGTGLTNSILRYYDIQPDNNTNLNATLRFNYFDGELNGLNEDLLGLFQSNDAIHWSAQGFSSKDATANFVEKSGITSLSRWTLSILDDPLPVVFTSFNATCDGSSVLLTWKTAQEQNSDHFDIEKSPDGFHWAVIGTVPAKGNSSTESSYSFAIKNPVQNDFYRVAEYDFNGPAYHTSVIKTSCNIKDEFKLWPNPFHDLALVNIVAGNESQMTMKVFDSKGALVKVQSGKILQGSNSFVIDLRSFANGIYQVQASWNNGQAKKVVQVIKE